MNYHKVTPIVGDREDSSWEKGYQKFELSQWSGGLDLGSSILELSKYYIQLPRDPYDTKNTRYRWYGRGLYLPWEATFEWLPEEVAADGKSYSAYYQAGHNPEHREEFRYFETIPPAARTNEALVMCIRNALAQTEWGNGDNFYPVSVGIHFISQRVDRDNPVATVSPNCMHQDGETFDFVFLINRDGVEGGENFVAPPAASGKLPEDLLPAEIIDQFTLSKPMQGFGVKDVMVSHGVTEVKLCENSSYGYRNTLLIDTVTMREKYR